MDNLIELKNINKIYGTQIQTQVLFDINLQIQKGEFTSIIGQSGSGKSTLLNIIGTLDKPSSGEVYLQDTRIDRLKPNQLAALRNKTLGFIFQFHYLIPEFTALENVLMPHFIKTKKVDWQLKKRAEELMQLVGLEKVKNNLASAMSGGQQQRTAIARALINEPPLILADEPTGNLDSDTSETIYDLLYDINQKQGTTFLIITHDRRIAEKTNRIIEIRDGKVESDFKKNFI